MVYTTSQNCDLGDGVWLFFYPHYYQSPKICRSGVPRTNLFHQASMHWFSAVRASCIKHSWHKAPRQRKLCAYQPTREPCLGQPCLGQRCKRILCRCRCSRRNQDCTPHIPAAFCPRAGRSLSWTSVHLFVFCVLHFLMFFRFCHIILQHPTRQIKQDSSQRREDHEVYIINPLAVPPHLEFAMPAVCTSCTLHRHQHCTRMACTWNPSTHNRHCRRCTGCPCPGRSDPCTSCSWNSLQCCTGKVHKWSCWRDGTQSCNSRTDHHLSQSRFFPTSQWK